jgi:hypothetical protein
LGSLSQPDFMQSQSGHCWSTGDPGVRIDPERIDSGHADTREVAGVRSEGPLQLMLGQAAAMVALGALLCIG